MWFIFRKDLEFPAWLGAVLVVHFNSLLCSDKAPPQVCLSVLLIFYWIILLVLLSQKRWLKIFTFGGVLEQLKGRAILV